MTTAATIIEDALREIGVLGDDQAMTAEQTTGGLRALNRLLERMSNQRLFNPVETQLSYPLTGSQSFTIGPSGADLTAARPLRVIGAYATLADISYPVRLLTAQEWDSIGYKVSSGGAPAGVYYEATYPSGTVYVYQPTAGYTLKLRVLTVIDSFADHAEDLALPPGYEEALVLNLAVRLAPGYGAALRAETINDARNALRIIKRTNVQIPTLNAMPRGDDSWLESGGL